MFRNQFSVHGKSFLLSLPLDCTEFSPPAHCSAPQVTFVCVCVCAFIDVYILRHNGGKTVEAAHAEKWFLFWRGFLSKGAFVQVGNMSLPEHLSHQLVGKQLLALASNKISAKGLSCQDVRAPLSFFMQQKFTLLWEVDKVLLSESRARILIRRGGGLLGTCSWDPSVTGTKLHVPFGKQDCASSN